MSRLDELIAQFLEAHERGENIDRARILRENPDLAEPFQEFLDSHDEFMGSVDSIASTQNGGDLTAPLVPMGSGDGNQDGAPDMIGNYEVLEEVDRGGMGVVFRARDPKLNRIVALKMIRSGRLASESDVQRFQAEARSAAKLDHPGIVPVYYVGTHESHPFFSMAFIEGQNLEAYYKDRTPDFRESCLLIKEVAIAIHHAHENGLIHRDLKPANILVDRHGKPRVTDFGLAKSIEKDDGLTGTGEILGTINFMAPEQAAAKNDQVSKVTDVYSLGAMLFFLCTGKAPFETDNPVDTLLRILDSEPTPLNQINSAIPSDLAMICLRCLEKDPKNRYQSAKELADELGRFLLGEPLESVRSGMRSGFRRWSRKEPVLVGHLVGLGLIESTRLVSYFTQIALFGGRLSEYLRFTYLIMAWAVACFILQKLQNLRPFSRLIKYAWAAVDIAFLTVILLMADQGIGPLFMTYPLVIVVSGLFVQVRLVLLTTFFCLISFVFVYLRQTPLEEIGHYGVVGVASITSIGYVMAVLVHRIRSLNRLFE